MEYQITARKEGNEYIITVISLDGTNHQWKDPLFVRAAAKMKQELRDKGIHIDTKDIHIDTRGCFT